ncbi:MULTISPECIES: hypothetical protein [Entomomonas]|uniref:Uncharacterized protein n=1 Tax=Entomomonas asaccharolytica TaxID=2785331 RepID=A0A974NI07_9GAMM|nr:MULTISPECIES: hypothetical protein [Entomomonas]QQP86844.1 hypothetical protein JHT90_06275 [Entomomonas asaccharolytica]UYZ83538.1 hypothetical protein MTZ49_13180 [Entomomonas sp. E2T0]
MTDNKFVNFQEDHELNYQLKKHELRQTEANREKLQEIGKQTRKDTNKRKLTQDEVSSAISRNKNQFEKKK